MHKNSFTKASLILMISLATSLLFLSSCERTDPEPENLLNKDYFPLINEKKWEYSVKSIDTYSNESYELGAIAITISGDSTISGKKYKKVLKPVFPFGTENYEVTLVRKEGSEYFGIHQDLYQGGTQEYKFLDEDIPLNSSWEFEKSSNEKTEYVIVGKNTTKSINGKEYKEIIEVAVNYFLKQEDKWVKQLTIHHWYAKGVGEVYAYYPYPTSLTYVDLQFTLQPEKPSAE